MKKHSKSNQLQSRRRFIKTTGGILFFASLPIGLSLESCNDPMPQKRSFSEGQNLNIWVEMNEEGQVRILNPSSEMGQGSMTALPIIIAEEMDLDWEKVYIENSPVEPDLYGAGWGGRGAKSMITVGSRTVMSYFNMLRQVGAQARYVLLKSVANSWNVPMEELKTDIHKVIHEGRNQGIAYGDILPLIKQETEIPEIPDDQLKNPKDFRLIGKSVDRFDIPYKVDGSAEYSIDVTVPGMLYGVINRSPVNGSKPNIENESEILALPGINRVVVLDHGVGIIGEDIQSVLGAKMKLQVSWTGSENTMSHNSEEVYDTYQKIGENKLEVLDSKGNIKSAFKRAKKIYRSNYKNDYIYHAQMEPLNAIASINDDESEIEIWIGTQAPGNVRRSVARALDIEAAQVKMNRLYLGGGFGRRSATDYVLEAVELTKSVKKPVKLIWTREDDIKYGMFRPISLQRMAAGVNENGEIIGWQHEVIGTGGGLLASGTEPEYYEFPNIKRGVYNIDHGIRTKHWRAVAHGPNKFAIEAFIDEIANDLEKDPLEFRLQMMNSERAKIVLQTAAEMAEWNKPSEPGKAKGIAFAERSGSLSACVCEISYNPENGIRVHNVWASLDAGIVVQPDNAIAQMEGGINMGISSVLKESISIENGEVQQSNYNDYVIMRIDECPEMIEVKIIDSNVRPTGIGESGVPIIAGAISNAFASLTGVRLRHLPFTPDKIAKLMES